MKIGKHRNIEKLHLESQIKAMASSLNISISKFISGILEQKVQNEWSHGTSRFMG